MIIDVREITIKLGDNDVFQNSSWSLSRGENWAIIGSNGSGKTVFVKSLLKQIPIVRGQIIYGFNDPAYPKGRPYFHPNEIQVFSAETHQAFLRKYAAYHQARWQSFEGEDNPSVSDLLSKENLLKQSPFEVTKGIDLEGFAERTDFANQLFHLDELMDRKIHQLSHGESRKVFLSRMIMRSPKLIIFDDPFTGLDESTRSRLGQAIQSIFTRGEPAGLFVTSRWSELPDSIDHLLYIDSLKIRSQGKRGVIRASEETGMDRGKPNAHILSGKTVDSLGGVPLVLLENVTVEYGKIKSLDQVSWCVRIGEHWALQGPNGAGKTTLLSLILGDHPQAYRYPIELFGIKRGSGESIWDIKRKIGWVSPELQAFFEPHFTCLDVVQSGLFDAVGLYHKRTRENILAAKQMLEMFSVRHLSDLPFASLSTGQQRIVLLARALVKKPPLLILDEPCQGLDETHRMEFIKLIDQVCEKTDLTLIYVTHDRSELPASITHRLVLERGKVISSGPIGK